MKKALMMLMLVAVTLLANAGPMQGTDPPTDDICIVVGDHQMIASDVVMINVDEPGQANNNPRRKFASHIIAGGSRGGQGLSTLHPHSSVSKKIIQYHDLAGA